MSTTENTKRVLHIVSSMDRGGTETLLMNIYRNIDRTKIQFDFITHTTEKEDYEEEIYNLGGKIHKVASLGTQGPIKYLKELMRVMSLNHYVAVHSHTDYQSGFPALAGRICGIKTRICHSHSNNWPRNKGLKDKFLLKILQTFIKITATHYCGCSLEAGEFLFGKKMVDNHKVEILKNGIDIEQFLSIENSKEEVLYELKLPKEVKIIGHVGRFSPSKNHSFILKVFKELVEQDPTFIILFIGEGQLKNQIEQEAITLGVLDSIRFLGVRTDIPRLMKALDVFIFPSLFEGFGIVTLEAQCAGTSCVVSDTLPKTTDMGLGLISYLSLEEDLKVWSNEINKAISVNRPENQTIYNNFQKYGFNIQENVPKWLSLYLDKDQNISSAIN